jgi:hypothetical protein
VKQIQSGGPTKSGSSGRPMPPDSGGKRKNREKVFPFNNLALLNLDLAKKMLKKVKKGKNELRQPPIFSVPKLIVWADTNLTCD